MQSRPIDIATPGGGLSGCLPLAGAMNGHARSLWKERSFYRMLARMEFPAAHPEQRHRAPGRVHAATPVNPCRREVLA